MVYYSFKDEEVPMYRKKRIKRKRGRPRNLFIPMLYYLNFSIDNFFIIIQYKINIKSLENLNYNSERNFRRFSRIQVELFLEDNLKDFYYYISLLNGKTDFFQTNKLNKNLLNLLDFWLADSYPHFTLSYFRLYARIISFYDNFLAFSTFLAKNELFVYEFISYKYKNELNFIFILTPSWEVVKTEYYNFFHVDYYLDCVQEKKFVNFINRNFKVLTNRVLKNKIKYGFLNTYAQNPGL